MKAQWSLKEHHQPADVNHTAAGVRPKLRLVYKVRHFQPKAFASNDDSYDVNGHLTTLVSSQNYLYFDGRGVGDYGTGGAAASNIDYAMKMAQEDAARNSQQKYTVQAVTSADVDYNFQPINGASGQASFYTVQGSYETLEQIAAQLWGDSSLWYLIAEVNGFTSKDTALSEGLTLTLPNVNTNFHNNVNTFKPYNPNDLLGNVQPASPPYFTH